MGPRLVFDTFDDIRGRCDTAPARQAGSELGYDHGAIVPSDDWVPLTTDPVNKTITWERVAPPVPLAGRSRALEGSTESP
ncbi:hypothetical protein OG393_33420 (plasmid) [Streptomyces sp. NBC_01216]|uniref:hypothetical protein n=1 Tax=Streptomyces sp. NBC_01216 TaxID=2903778 RepID=UPI002E1060B4|nr:hypothetical protein OG393_33420 [Streptomyces sp. NBC_01216]